MLDQFNSEKWFKKFKLKAFPEPEYIQLRHPVLLCHGYGAFASLVKPSPLNDVAMFMRSHGVPAFAPNIVPYAKIEIRSKEWKTLIRQLSERYDISKFNIVAHSMGGLDIRYALSKLELERYVASLTTVATPHHGTSLAELVLKAPDSVQGKLGDFFDWMGDRVYPKTKSDAIGSVKQLTRSYVQERFNNEIRNLESIPYFSFSAAVGKGTTAPIETVIRFQNNHIYENEGINDGLVSARSAIWGEHIKTAPISHLEQMSLRTDKDRMPVVKSFWLDVLKMLQEKGF
ncbi:lipase family alpha/beta hydrolase [Halalkalibaculum sp. DA3122]|uniref:lipase family alpha/beta hydrolase n=1 Tax=unclassified Halalkalibaculum TaxID=2964617 RepID=UPI003754352F